MKRIKLIAIIILTVSCLIVILQNTVPVETRLLFMTVIMPQAILLCIVMIIGFLIGVIVAVHYLNDQSSATGNKQR